ncbi:hypothetical protein ACJIZ3_002436 [Penstemon smallii]|uniref:Uncharacterized protein n=1 Tax=Penstemon smallii TaxID=265156 RepID=A0ABD3U901_9LAMI
MEFWSLLTVASMPILQMLIISLLGAFIATDYLNLLSSDAQKSINKIVFVVFTPSLVFGSLAKAVSFQDIISWWFMPINIGITYLVGGSFGWIAVKLLRPKPHLQDLIIAMCSSGNLGNILLMIIPAICKEDGNPFGDKIVCTNDGLSYNSLSMALGIFYLWTFTYHLIRRSGAKYEAMLVASKEPNTDLETNDENSLLLNGAEHVHTSSTSDNNTRTKILRILHRIGEELKTPPILAAILGIIFGAVTWLQNLIIGVNAPLRVVNDSIQLLGNATIPCTTIVLGGSLTQGVQNSRLKSGDVIAVIFVRYIILPAVGIFVVKAASHLGFIPSDPLFHFVLLIQFTLPPATNIGTMTQLFDVAKEECALLFLWTYLVAALALTGWSSVFMWILS